MSDHEKPRAFGFLISPKKIQFLQLLQPYAWFLVFGCLLLLLTNLISATLPILINAGVSLIENELPFVLNLYIFELNFLNIYWILLTVLLLAIVGAVLRTFSRMVIFDIGRRIERNLREKLFYHISVLDDDFFIKHSVGDLMNHLTTDMANVRMVTGFAALNIMNIIFIFCFTVPLLLKIDVQIALCALLPFPLIILAMTNITKKMFLATIDYQKQLSRMANHIQENLLGAHIVRLFHQQKQESERFLITNQKTFDEGIKLARVRVLMLPIMRLIIGIAVGLVLFVGGRAILTGRINLGDFVEINARILQLAWPAMSVGFVMSVYSRGQASLTRINELLDYLPSIRDGEQVLNDVHTVDVHNLVLNNEHIKTDPISFKVNKGQMIGIVGPSGSFKTTLLRAIFRRYKIPPGAIFFDGYDINDLTLSSIYDQISVVSEGSFLFHKTIRDNICFARPDASEDEIAAVVKLTRLDRDLANFKDGLETVVGERGITLSGGQRQRVVLARALLAKRPVFIMDDALSSVDTDTEQYIVSRLPDYLKNSIVIMATHRLSALRQADQILVLEKGRVLGFGTHKKLLADNDLYKGLWGFSEMKGQS